MIDYKGVRDFFLGINGNDPDERIRKMRKFGLDLLDNLENRNVRVARLEDALAEACAIAVAHAPESELGRLAELKAIAGSAGAASQ